jgi:hypothetical protein
VKTNNQYGVAEPIDESKPKQTSAESNEALSKLSQDLGNTNAND